MHIFTALTKLFTELMTITRVVDNQPKPKGKGKAKINTNHVKKLLETHEFCEIELKIKQIISDELNANKNITTEPVTNKYSFIENN